MKIDFRPVAKFSEVLVGESVSNDAKTVDRYFAYLKQGLEIDIYIQLRFYNLWLLSVIIFCHISQQ